MAKKVLAVALATFLWAGIALGASFTWSEYAPGDVCCEGCSCTQYLMVWEAWRYVDACPEDTKITTEDWPVNIPAVCVERINALPKLKVEVKPPGWKVFMMVIRSETSPLLQANRSYVSIVFRCENTNCSDYSNRVLWKTPLKIDPFGITLEK